VTAVTAVTHSHTVQQAESPLGDASSKNLALRLALVLCCGVAAAGPAAASSGAQSPRAQRDTLPVTFQPADRQQPACRHAAAARQASASQAPSSWSRRVASRKKERAGGPAGVDDSNPQS
jgi:hypothetical protein